MNRQSLFLLGLVFSCKTVPTAAPPVETPAEPPVAEVAVELPAAPQLPPTPLGLADLGPNSANPVTAEKVDLGYKLFFDKRLSKDGTMACAACHHIDKAYTSGMALDPKVGGAVNKRNAPSMLNLAYHTSYYWDGRGATLEAVSLAAWKGQLGADPEAIATTLNAHPTYKAMFMRAFGTAATPKAISDALGAWLRVLQNGNSAYDRSQAGDAKAMSADAKSGLKVFTSKGCVTCHVPPLFTDSAFHNIGIGDDAGRKEITKSDDDAGKFKTPSLRGVAQSAPYFHDGSAATLDEAIAIMAAGSKKAGVDPAFKAVKLSAKEKKALRAFLESLSGESSFAAEPSLP